MKRMKGKEMALVCSGGGALGVAHLGVLSELEKDGREYVFFAGVSAGAVVCAMKAYGMSTAEIWRFARETNFFELTLDFTRNRYGFLSGNKMVRILKKVFKKAKIEDLKYPLYIGATDFRTGERVIISEGKIVDALRASCGFPVIFTPFYHQEQKRWLVDGGLTRNFPLDIALNKFKKGRITGIDLNYYLPRRLNFSSRTFLGAKKELSLVISRMFKIMYRAQREGLLIDERVDLYEPDMGDLVEIDVRKNSIEAIYDIGRRCVAK